MLLEIIEIQSDFRLRAVPTSDAKSICEHGKCGIERGRKLFNNAMELNDTSLSILLWLAIVL